MAKRGGSRGRLQVDEPRDFTQTTVRIPRTTKANIDLVGALEGRSAGLVIAAAVDAYVAALPLATRKALEELRAVRMGAGR